MYIFAELSVNAIFTIPILFAIPFFVSMKSTVIPLLSMTFLANCGFIPLLFTKSLSKTILPLLSPNISPAKVIAPPTSLVSSVGCTLSKVLRSSSLPTLFNKSTGVDFNNINEFFVVDNSFIFSLENSNLVFPSCIVLELALASSMNTILFEITSLFIINKGSAALNANMNSTNSCIKNNIFFSRYLNRLFLLFVLFSLKKNINDWTLRFCGLGFIRYDIMNGINVKKDNNPNKFPNCKSIYYSYFIAF